MSSAFLLLPAALACLTLTSCIVAEGPPIDYYPQAQVTRQGWYERVPSSYRGETYQHGGRYYYGGRQEQGRFTDHGRTYTQRYQHGGQYYYGGQANTHRPGPRSGNY